MIKVSVIIPVYNVEKYLVKCMDSVINQTLKDIEIICVDDGSTDNCPAILDQYAESDNRIKVIHKPNGGYGKAMNVGFNAAQGEYIGIVESDDFILPEMYETLYNHAVENKLDVVKSDFNLYWSISDTILCSHKKEYEYCYCNVLGGKKKNILISFGSSNWTGIYKRDFLNNNIHHNETPGASYQDTGFWFQILAMADNVMIIDRAFYMYRQDNFSSSMKSKQKMLCLIDECKWVRKIFNLKIVSDEWVKYCYAYQFKCHLMTFKRIDDSLKLEYRKIARDDYINNKEMVEEPIDGFMKETYEWLEKVAENPKAVFDEYIFGKNEITEVISSVKKLIIYGTGKRAAKVCLGFYSQGYSDKISCVVVSDKPTSETFFEKPVKCIDEIEDKNTLILISVKKGTDAYNEIESNLRSLGFTNVIDSEIICNYFYTIL